MNIRWTRELRWGPFTLRLFQLRGGLEQRLLVRQGQWTVVGTQHTRLAIRYEGGRS